MTEKELSEIRRLIEAAENNLWQLKKIIFRDQLIYKYRQPVVSSKEIQEITEGIFDGEQMLGDDGKNYPVPANYASKSKLVSGDRLKLTILEDGSFIFKQIKPVERIKLIGELKETAIGQYQVVVEEKSYNILLAAVTYYNLQPGDRLSIIVPKEGEAVWAAVDNKI